MADSKDQLGRAFEAELADLRKKACPECHLSTCDPRPKTPIRFVGLFPEMVLSCPACGCIFDPSSGLIERYGPKHPDEPV